MRRWNSSFDAQGSRVTIIVVQVGAVKIYVTAVETLRKKRKSEYGTQFILLPQKIDGKSLMVCSMHVGCVNLKVASHQVFVLVTSQWL